MFGVMFTIIPFFVFIIFAIVIGTFIVHAVKGVGQWNQNNQSPVITADARLVAKRTQVSHHTQAPMGENMPPQSTSSTACYATFEVESGSRMEFSLSGREYGMLAEGDCGKLTFQGTRFKGFERIPGMVLSRTASSQSASRTAESSGSQAFPPRSFSPLDSSRPVRTAASPNAAAVSSARGGRSAHQSGGDNRMNGEAGEPSIEFFFSTDEQSGDRSPRPAVTLDEMEAERNRR